ncbi:hypothetical protein DM01DRAFT_1337670 [Hesseltinella vesiculosa]|uniref:Uncharacterized protein n=1 Tax=Hesseltinella vesiculosa TaxID=101127 RepID=A0A1X2GCC0_9FUNG|nr:hypothetical protein DM01DRAFT_1337670 [Hesseltinella vesiculosa]
MTSEVAQVAGFQLDKTTDLSLSVEDAVAQGTDTANQLENLLELLVPKDVCSNEVAKEAYLECLKLKEYLNEQLWSVADNEAVKNIQTALDLTTRATLNYEMMIDAANGDWELVDVTIPSL